MRRHITRYIAHLHTRPEEERLQVAFAVSLAIAGLIFLIWLGFFFARLSRPTIVTLPAPSFQSAQERVDRILEDSLWQGGQDQNIPESTTQRDELIPARDTPQADPFREWSSGVRQQ